MRRGEERRGEERRGEERRGEERRGEERRGEERRGEERRGEERRGALLTIYDASEIYVCETIICTKRKVICYDTLWYVMVGYCKLLYDNLHYRVIVSYYNI